MLAVDLVARMVQRKAADRLKIGEAVGHPFFWDAAQQLDKIRGWKKTWRRGLVACGSLMRLVIVCGPCVGHHYKLHSLCRP